MPRLEDNVSDDTIRLVADRLNAGRAPSLDALVRAGVDAFDREAAKIDALRAAIDEGDSAPDADDHSLQGILAEAHLPQPGR